MTPRLTPVDVSGLTSGVSRMIGGAYFSCALTTGGGLQCWGDNTDGALGDGTTTSRPAPGAVSGLTSGVIAAGASFYHVCAVTSAGGVTCWGPNSSGQLGDGTTSPPSPRPM